MILTMATSVVRRERAEGKEGKEKKKIKENVEEKNRNCPPPSWASEDVELKIRPLD